MYGKNVRHAYKMTHSALQAVTTLKMVRSTVNKNAERPAKKRKREGGAALVSLPSSMEYAAS